MGESRTPVLLSIAGSDSGGGAGIQADLKAFAALGVHGTTAITAVTAQNTVGVTSIHPIPAAMILAQIEAVADDIGIDAIKVGMLGTRKVTEVVAGALGSLGGIPLVVDPVMVSESGARLLDDDAREALASDLLPLSTVVTPNLPEARILAAESRSAVGESGSPSEPSDDSPTEVSDQTPTEVSDLARTIRALGPEAVIVTGGHVEGADLLDDGEGQISIPGPMHPDGAAHGSGCTHSSSLAALLALGWPVREAAVEARARAADAIAAGLRDVGRGAGPVDALGIAGRRPPAR